MTLLFIRSQFSAKFREQDEAPETPMTDALKVIAVLYLVIGSLHSVMFDWVISRTACLTAKGLVGIYCNTGMAISHAAVAVAWPLYWLQETGLHPVWLTPA